MDRRIFGLETEYGVTCAPEDGRGLSADEVARYLFRKVVAWGRSSNVFLRNGSRLYLDVGSHPEYATAECDDVRQLVTHDRAGERILEGLVADAQQRLEHEGLPGRIHLFKNNTDSAGNSYGCHENYLVRRQGDFARLSDVLVPFLITRQILTGAGKVLTTPRGARYCLSQRADHIWEAVSSATTRSRPIINTRDEPHADAEHYRRLHVIVGDSSMSETTTMLKVGSTDLHPADDRGRRPDAGHGAGEPDPGDPGDQPRHDRHAPGQLANGRTVTAVDLQEEYLARVKDFVAAEVDADPRGQAGARPVGARAARAAHRRPVAGGPRARLGHQVPAHRAVPRQARPRDVRRAGRPAGPGVPRHLPHRGPVQPARRARAGRAGRRPTSRSSRRPPSRRRPRGPSCAATSCARRRRPGATTRSTGCTSSSTTRPSAPSCARTRSAASTSGWTGSSSPCSPA